MKKKCILKGMETSYVQRGHCACPLDILQGPHHNDEIQKAPCGLVDVGASQHSFFLFFFFFLPFSRTLFSPMSSNNRVKDQREKDKKTKRQKEPKGRGKKTAGRENYTRLCFSSLLLPFSPSFFATEHSLSPKKRPLWRWGNWESPVWNI